MAILRLGHRISRDQRITTHVGLTARALGASSFLIHGDFDKNLLKTFRKLEEKNNIVFPAVWVDDWQEECRSWKKKGEIVHLTMLGVPILDVLPEIRVVSKKKDILVVVGGKKVPRKIFKKEFTDWNVSITHHPHSEVAALAIFLEKLIPNALTTVGVKTH